MTIHVGDERGAFSLLLQEFLSARREGIFQASHEQRSKERSLWRESQSAFLGSQLSVASRLSERGMLGQAFFPGVFLPSMPKKCLGFAIDDKTSYSVLT